MDTVMVVEVEVGLVQVPVAVTDELLRAAMPDKRSKEDKALRRKVLAGMDRKGRRWTRRTLDRIAVEAQKFLRLAKDGKPLPANVLAQFERMGWIEFEPREGYGDTIRELLNDKR